MVLIYCFIWDYLTRSSSIDGWFQNVSNILCFQGLEDAMAPGVILEDAKHLGELELSGELGYLEGSLRWIHPTQQVVLILSS